MFKTPCVYFLCVSDISGAAVCSKGCLEQLVKLMPRTPVCVVYFLGGQLLATAQLPSLNSPCIVWYAIVCQLKEYALHKALKYKLSVNSLVITGS